MSDPQREAEDRQDRDDLSDGQVQPIPMPSTTRRNLLAVLGIATVAGCSDLASDEEANAETEATDEDTPIESAITPAEVIDQHAEQLSDLSYTFTLGYQGEESTIENKQEIEYKYDSEPDIAVLEKETTIDDGLDRLSQLYSETDVVANVVFENHESIMLTLREGEYEHEQLTGASIFDQYLPGSAFDESHEEEGGTVTVYELVSHRFFDSLDGTLKIDGQGLIQRFHFKWLDAQDQEHWMEFDLTDVGEATIDIGPEFEADA